MVKNWNSRIDFGEKEPDILVEETKPTKETRKHLFYPGGFKIARREREFK